MKIACVIKGPTKQDVLKQMEIAFPTADLVEIRLDCFDVIDFSFLRQLRLQFPLPQIFTLRSQAHGGHFEGSLQQHKDIALNLLLLNPEYLDLGWDIDHGFIQEIRLKAKIILSYHNFTTHDVDLDQLYGHMQKIPADVYKIAVHAKNTSDALRLISFGKEKNVIAISMGSYGEVSRLLLRPPIHYAACDEKTTSAPGQLPIHTIINQYNIRKIDEKTAFYGLIGDPVTRSISHKTHNALMDAFSLHARYVKMGVTLNELPTFLSFAKDHFHGLSVTMPLKEAILPFLDEVDRDAQAIGAVNTLSITGGKILGYNTDGIGALNALQKYGAISGKKLVILGAGGTASAIAYEAVKRGACVIVLNRNILRAQVLEKKLNIIADSLEQIGFYAKEGYDILINATPDPLPINPQYILPHAIAMDVSTIPKETPFLSHAKDKGCRVIYGYEMFLEQAVQQFHIWFKLDVERGRSYLQDICLSLANSRT